MKKDREKKQKYSNITDATIMGSTSEESKPMLMRIISLQEKGKGCVSMMIFLVRKSLK